jgi:hypothetical protein
MTIPIGCTSFSINGAGSMVSDRNVEGWVLLTIRAIRSG